jgi:hypothetical protein
MAKPSPKTMNKVMASVLLKDAIQSLDQTIRNCRAIIQDALHLPKGVSVIKKLHCISNQLHHIETISQTIHTEISPHINLASDTGYLCNRLKAAQSSLINPIPSTMRSNLLPSPPSPSSTSKTPKLSSSSSSTIKKRSILKDLTNETNKRKSKRLKSMQLPTRKLFNDDTTTMPIPPSGCAYFSIHDAMNEYEKFGKGIKLIEFWIRNSYILCKKTRFFKLYKMYKSNTLPPDANWIDDAGRKPILSLQQVQDLVLGTQSCSSGRSYSLNDINDTLIQAKEEHMKQKGKSVLVNINVSRQTIYNYKSLTALCNETKIVNKVQQKTDSRFTAESSILSTISYLMTVACSHLVVGDRDESINPHPIKNATPGAILLHNLVQDCNNKASIRHISPSLQFSTDDSTMFVFKGTARKIQSWTVVPKVEQKNRQTHQSYYANDVGGTDNLNGTRVRLTYTMNAMGMTAAPFITIYGLNERELSKDVYPDGHLIVAVPGLCAGGSQDVRIREVGYLCFIRSEKSTVNNKTAEQRNFEYYREKVLFPFIASIRETLFDWSPGTPIPDTLSAVCWSDGACSQLQAITNENQQVSDSYNKITCCKHSAARTAEEQACDLASVFRTVNTLSKGMTNDDVKGGLYILVSRIFKKLKAERALNLSLVKEQALIDFVSCYPSILSRSACPTSVAKGFLYNGMIDKNTKNWPDMKAILSTCKNTKLTEEEESKIIQLFPLLYEEQCEKGHLSDQFLEELGFTPDKNFAGNTVRRNALITNESCQRAKCLSHLYQRELRKKVLFDKNAKQVLKLTELRNKAIEQHRVAEVVEKFLLSKEQEVSVSDFTKFKTPELKAFIYVRSYIEINKKANSEFQMPTKKGKVQDAEAGELNLLSLTFQLKNAPKVLKIPQEITASSVSNRTLPDIEVPVILLGNNAAEEKKPSFFLSNNQWVGKVCSSFKGIVRVEPNVVESQVASFVEVDHLYKILLLRLQQHLHLRVKDKTKHNNYSINWFHANLPRFCAIAFLSTHITTDLRSTTRSDTLLGHPSDTNSTFVNCENTPFSDLEGCYLYYDSSRFKWIRSGKAVGSRHSNPRRTFRKRHAEHKHEARSAKGKYSKSNFYSCYPSNELVGDSNNSRRRGFFENLVQYCGVGFDRDGDTTAIVSENEDDGIFTWSDDVVKRVESLRLSTCTELQDKKLNMVGFLLELGYDLMINSDDNVSESPGFEPCLGIFGGSL